MFKSVVLIVCLIEAKVSMGQDQGGGGGGGGVGGGGSSDQCNLDQNCWQFAEGCTLADGFPFDRRTPVSCDECAQLCQKKQQGKAPYICKSAVYDCQWKTCDLFAVQAKSPQTLTKYAGRTYFQPSGAAKCGGANSGGSGGSTPATGTNDCPAGQKAVLSIFQNSTASLPGAKDISAGSAEKCGLLCVQNQDDKGNSAVCKAATFNSGKCTFSDQPPVPDSFKSLQPGSDPNSIYIEKKCLPAGGPGETCTTIIIDPHHVLVGYDRKTYDAKSYDDCLTQCFTAKEIQCRAGQYYSDVGPTENCVLIAETQGTKPDLYLATDDQNLYFEPKCGTGRELIFAAKKVKAKLALQDIVLPEQTEWTLWTDCTEGKTEKHRWRNCRQTRITKCPRESQPCNATEETDKDGFISKLLHQLPEEAPCEPLPKSGEQGKKRCDRGIRLYKNGTRSYCKPKKCDD